MIVMRSSTKLYVAVVGSACAIGCNAITGVNDLDPVGYDAITSRDGSSGGAADGAADANTFGEGKTHGLDDAGASGDGTGIAFDASEAGLAEAGATLCTGLTMLLRLDGKLTSAEGQAPQGSYNVSFVPGQFGRGVTFNGPSFVDYAGQSGGATIVSTAQGTVSMWVLANTWQMPCKDTTRTFFGLDTGLYTDCEPNGLLGVWIDMGPNNSVGAQLPPGPAQAAWVAGYNNLVATWSLSPPKLSIMLNGAILQEVSAPWHPPNPNVGVFHLGDPNKPPAAFDDVAVWTRALSQPEMAAIHAAGKSLGDVCGLP